MGGRLRKNDQVVVIAGKDKGARGKILKVLPAVDKVIVEGVHKVKRHTKPTQKLQQGGIIEKELPIHASKVMLLDSKEDKPTRVRFKLDKDGNKTRVSARSGAVLEG
jgi:large subunit ribosomal protein L24